MVLVSLVSTVKKHTWGLKTRHVSSPYLFRSISGPAVSIHRLTQSLINISSIKKNSLLLLLVTIVVVVDGETDESWKATILCLD